MAWLKSEKILGNWFHFEKRDGEILAYSGRRDRTNLTLLRKSKRKSSAVNWIRDELKGI